MDPTMIKHNHLVRMPHQDIEQSYKQRKKQLNKAKAQKQEF